MSGTKKCVQKIQCQNPCQNPCQRPAVCKDQCQDSYKPQGHHQHGTVYIPKPDPCNPCVVPVSCCPNPCDPCQGQGRFGCDK